jgi:hypothetical protein
MRELADAAPDRPAATRTLAVDPRVYGQRECGGEQAQARCTTDPPRQSSETDQGPIPGFGRPLRAPVALRRASRDRRRQSPSRPRMGARLRLQPQPLPARPSLPEDAARGQAARRRRLGPLRRPLLGCGGRRAATPSPIARRVARMNRRARPAAAVAVIVVIAVPASVNANAFVLRPAPSEGFEPPSWPILHRSIRRALRGGP